MLKLADCACVAESNTRNWYVPAVVTDKPLIATVPGAARFGGVMTGGVPVAGPGGTNAML